MPESESVPIYSTIALLRLWLTNQYSGGRFPRFNPRVFALECQAVRECAEHVPEHVLQLGIVPNKMFERQSVGECQR